MRGLLGISPCFCQFLRQPRLGDGFVRQIEMQQLAATAHCGRQPGKLLGHQHDQSLRRGLFQRFQQTIGGGNRHGLGRANNGDFIATRMTA